MSSSYDIQPAPKTFTYTMTRISIATQTIVFDQSAVFAVMVYDNEGVCRDFQNLTMEGDDYQKWTTDDYVVSWVCKKLGFTPIA